MTPQAPRACITWTIVSALAVLILALAAICHAAPTADSALADCQRENNELRIENRDLKAEIATREKMHSDAIATYVSDFADIKGRNERAMVALAGKDQ